MTPQSRNFCFCSQRLESLEAENMKESFYYCKFVFFQAQAFRRLQSWLFRSRSLLRIFFCQKYVFLCQSFFVPSINLCCAPLTGNVIVPLPLLFFFCPRLGMSFRFGVNRNSCTFVYFIKRVAAGSNPAISHIFSILLDSHYQIFFSIWKVFFILLFGIFVFIIL